MKLRFITTLLLVLILIGSCKKDEEITTENFISISSVDGDLLFTEDLGIFNNYSLGDNNLDQISLVLGNSSGLNCQIYISGSKLLDQDLPLDVPNSINSAHGEVQIRDFTKDVELTYGPNDSINYVGHTSDGVRFEILSYEDDYISGTFSGTVATRTGKEITINEGEFGLFIELNDSN